MALKDLKMDYRTTKEIIERICLNSELWCNFQGQRIYTIEQMYIAISNDLGLNCYELKITAKKDRLEKFDDKRTSDSTKNEFLELLELQLSLIFPRICYNGGALIVRDDMKDYAITLVKKKQCIWKSSAE